jgi:DNA-binding NarL/FixJ family response regulator
MLFILSSSVENGSPAPGGRPEGLSLLLVEDDEQIRDSLLDWLASVFRDSQLVGAPSDEVLTLALVEPPQVVLADIALTDGDGLATVRRVSSAFPGAHVVALVGGSEGQSCDAVLAAGASACLPIWHVHKKLVPTVRRLLT